jgi:D-lactate dehydrogenase (cytochrome)
MTYDCSFLSDLALEGEVSVDEATRESHAGDWGTREADQVRPIAVVYPQSTADVSAVLAAVNERRVPVTPYAAGSGPQANATPVHGGISLDLTRMDTVSAIRPDDPQVDVEPGVYGGAVNEAVADHGLWFPPLPSSGDISTVGGMIATDVAGMQTVRYGEVGDWFLPSCQASSPTWMQVVSALTRSRS